MPDRTEKQKMLAGELYRASDPELVADLRRAELLLVKYNATTSDQPDHRAALLRDLLGSVGPHVTVRPPFRCDYGFNIHMGTGIFFNFGCVFLDVCRIDIGDYCQFGPNVHIYAADHPRDPSLRQGGLENGIPVSIGRNVWIGGGAKILPGIRVGDGAIIGAGSIVTRNVPAGATVAGNPARPLRSKTQ